MLEREGASWSLIPSSNTFPSSTRRLRWAPSSPHSTHCCVCWGCSLPCLPPSPALLSRLCILFTESPSFLSLSFPRTCITVENAQMLAPVPELSLSHTHWVPGAQSLSAAGIIPDHAQQLLLTHSSVSSCFDWPSSRSPNCKNLRIQQFSSFHQAPAKYLAGELMWLPEACRGSYLGSWRTLFRSGVTVAMWLCHECVP